MDRIKKIAIIFLIALLAGLFGVFIYNSDLLFSDTDRGYLIIDEANSDISRSEGEISYVLHEESYARKLVFELDKPEGEAAGAPKLRIELTDKNGDIRIVEDSNPYNLATETINVRDGLKAVTVSYENCSIRTLWIYNELTFDPYVFIFAFLLALCGSALIIFRKWLTKRPEAVFAVIALCAGICMCLSLPRDKVGYDEEEHLKAILDISAFPEGRLYLSDAIYDQLSVSVRSSSDLIPGSLEEMRELDHYLSENGDYVTGDNVFEHDTMKNRAPAYASQVAAVKLGMILGLSWPVILVLARLADLFMYVLLMYAAIRKTPIGKWLLTLIGLFPQNIFMASTLSYDPFVSGCLFLGTAYMFSYFSMRDAGEGAAFRELFMMAVFFILGCLPKAVYAPMMLMSLAGISVPVYKMIKRENGPSSRDAGRQRSIGDMLSVIVPIAGFMVMIAIFILPTAFAPAETGDLRGGATSEVSQVGYILSDPIGYALLLIRQMISWIPQCFIGPDCTTFMGALVHGSSEFRGYYLPYFLMMVFLCITEPSVEGERLRLGIGRRIWIFLMIGAASVLIWTSMYVAFTVPGSDTIAGVQGRYFIPLIYPLYLLFYSAGKELPAKLERLIPLWYYLMMAVPYLFIFLTIWKVVISGSCL